MCFFGALSFAARPSALAPAVNDCYSSFPLLAKYMPLI